VGRKEKIKRGSRKAREEKCAGGENKKRRRGGVCSREKARGTDPRNEKILETEEGPGLQ